MVFVNKYLFKTYITVFEKDLISYGFYVHNFIKDITLLIF